MEPCRICGNWDEKIVHIFRSTSEKKKPLSEKIMTVYPIIIYESDPLSKYICWKCFKNVRYQYSETERVIANQKNLIANLEVNTAGNAYINTLRVLEKSFNVATDIIDTRIGETLLIPHMNFIGQLKSSYLPESPKKLLNDNDQNDISISNLFTESDFIRPSEEEAESKFFTCKYCTFTSDSSASLTQHQTEHTRLKMPKIFKKRILDENSRRGSPIIINNNEYIRCQNCGNIYEDTNQIIQHWELAECVFYCEICSQEFPSTEVLNKHILEIHGITVSSLMDARNEIMPSKVKIIEIEPVNGNTEKKSQTNNTSGNGNIKIIKVGLAKMKVLTSSASATKKITKPTYKPDTTEIMPENTRKPAMDTRTCSICFLQFNNFLACNAHMRKHKMSKNTTEKNQRTVGTILCSICFLRFKNVFQYNTHMRQHSMISNYGTEQLNNQISDVTETEAEKAPLQLETVDGEEPITSDQPSSQVEKINQEDPDPVLENNSIVEKPELVNNEPPPPVPRVRKKFVPYREHKSPIPLRVKDISKLKYMPANTAIKLLE